MGLDRQTVIDIKNDLTTAYTKRFNDDSFLRVERYDLTADKDRNLLAQATRIRYDQMAAYINTIDANYNADYARKIAYDMAPDTGGRSSTLRTFGKDAHIYMAACRITLDAMLALRGERLFPFNVNGFCDPEHATTYAVRRETKPTKTSNGAVHTHPKAGTVHKQFEQLLDYVRAGIHTYLPGEAGGGKTTAARQVAKVLEVPFYSVSANPQMSKHDLFGYMDAHGNYVGTELYDAVKHGGVYLIDELDAAKGDILTAINSVVDSSPEVSFPHERVTKHDDFIVISSGNTIGKGATADYQRNKIDGATLDRFSFITWDYDEALEREFSENDTWVDTVQRIRKIVHETGTRMLVTPRASLTGAKLLAVGRPFDEVLDTVIFKGIAPDTANKIKAKAGL